MEDGGPGHLGTVVQTTVDPHVYMVSPIEELQFSFYSKSFTI